MTLGNTKSLYEIAKRLEMTGKAVSCYEAAVRTGCFDEQAVAEQVGLSAVEVAAARRTLSELDLLVAGTDGEPPVPVDPRVVESVLTLPLERDIAERHAVVARVRHELRKLMEIYARRPRPTAEESGIRVVESGPLVVAELEAAARRCGEEVLTMQPGGARRADTLEAALERDRAMLHNGVSMRVLYQHTARASAVTRRYVRTVTTAGARVRTTAELADRLIIFDRRLAFVPMARRGGEAPGAVIVDEPNLVSYLHRGFEGCWQSGVDFDADRTGDELSVGEVRGAILRLMALGHKDAVVARKIGMSARTARKHIAAIADELGTTSRFQAGVRAAYLGLVPDPAPTEDQPRPRGGFADEGGYDDGPFDEGFADEEG